MGLGAAIVGAAAIGSVGVIAAGSMQAGAAKSAAKTQANAEMAAANTQQQMFQQTQAGLAPYNEAGQQATRDIQNMSPFSFSPTEAQLESTPGYKFVLSQGLKSAQNGYAAQGLGTSGAAMKGATSYATGLADTTYQNQFSNALASYNQNLARLQNLSAVGENAAAQTGSFGTQTAANIGQTQVGAANAIAAGTVGSANATAGAISGISNNISNAFLMNSFLNNGSAGASIYSPYPGQAGFGGAPGVGLPGDLLY